MHNYQRTLEARVLSTGKPGAWILSLLATIQWLELATLVSACMIAAFCAVFFLQTAIPWLRFPADILSWSETDFVGSVIKLHAGLPYYTSPADSNSSIYTPGAPWLTFFLLKLQGVPVRVPTLRTVQLIFVAAASLVSFYNIRIMRRLVAPEARVRYPLLWGFLSLSLLFLAATSPHVNRLVLTLHTDALALLVSVVFWWAALQYVRNQRMARLLVLAVLPAIGFAVKPFLLAWLPVTAIVLVLLPFADLKQRSLTLSIYLAVALVTVLGIIGVFYTWWGSDFRFWVFDVMGGSRKRLTLAGEFNIALFRSIDHLFRAWWEVSLGVAAGLLTLRKSSDRRVIALFAGWVALVGFECLTSGAGWHVLYHFGPAVLIGVTWLIAVLPTEIQLFDDTLLRPTVASFSTRFCRSAMFALAIISICIALRTVPSRDRNDARWFPGVPPSAELYEQIQRTEQEFQGYSDGEVLLDVGNWVYLKSMFVARDRAVSLGDQPPGGHYENFGSFLDRIRSVHYKKILVRNFHEPTFLYDYGRWSRPSGARQALLDHYYEIRTIPAVVGDGEMFSGAVSVLVPKEDR